MADIFLSYHSSDRPRAEALQAWLEELGWSVWIDREIAVGEGWEDRIARELSTARVVIVLWSAQARRSEWVQREAAAALKQGRLVQIHATGLPLLPPFDGLQAVRMQSWSGESAHSEKRRLLRAVAESLGADPSTMQRIEAMDHGLPRLDHDLVAALELAFYYCSRQLECRRLWGSGEPADRALAEMTASFSSLNERLTMNESSASDDREGILHRMVEDFLHELQRLAPAPGKIP